jgi:hypothetical protein
LFYSSIGCLTGFFAHIFNGVVQSQIHFNSKFVIMTIRNFGKVIVIMTLATLLGSLIVLGVPDSFLRFIGSDKEFFHQLLYYLFAFAAFDFGLKN